jgi:hypothetical protein
MKQQIKIVIKAKPEPIINLLHDYFQVSESPLYPVFVDIYQRFMNSSSGNLYRD